MRVAQEYTLHALVRDILDLAFDAPDAPAELREQLLHVRELEHEPTGVGYFVYFMHAPAELHSDSQGSWDGPDLECTGLADHAQTIVHLKNGFIDNLEVWSVSGDFPKELPASYRLTQNWHGAPARWIVVKDGVRTTGQQATSN